MIFPVFKIVQLLDNNKPKEETENDELKFQIKMIQLFELDFQRAVKCHNKLFIELDSYFFNALEYLVNNID